MITSLAVMACRQQYVNFNTCIQYALHQAIVKSAITPLVDVRYDRLKEFNKFKKIRNSSV